MTPSILLVDDDAALLTLLARFFGKRGWAVSRAETGGEALEVFRRDRPAVVLLDLDLPDLNGITVLQRLRERDGDVTVVMLTGHGDVETAVEAMRLGATDFLTKPVELAHIAVVVDRALEREQLRQTNRARSGDPREGGSAEELGPSPLMRDVGHAVDRLAAGDSTVLLTGETGTGKGWVARRIHEQSRRARGPFVEINCGGLSAAFLDAELFGQEGAAPRGGEARKPGLLEVAGGGTLFLDEVGDLAPELQPKLLQVLESQHFRRPGGTDEVAVDVRLIAASNRDLRALVEAGRVREDLYYRLAVLPLTLPPLRERAPEDMAFLATRLLDELRERMGGGAPVRIADAALDRLVAYPWPGNIRELRNLLERILILSDDPSTIELRHLPAEVAGVRDVAGVEGRPMTLEEMERRHIRRVLEHTEGNRSRAARLLGISRATLYEKLDRYGLRDVGL